MTQKVIYVSYMRLTDKAERDWFIDYLRTEGAEVEFWDMVPLLFGGDSAGSKSAAYLRTPRTYQETEAMLRLPANKVAKYIMLVSYEGRTAGLYRLFSKHDCRMFFIAWGLLPINRERSWRGDLYRAVSHPVKFMRAAYNRAKAIAYRKLKLVKPYDVVFAAGRVFMTSAHYAKKVVPINLVDYDHYMRIKTAAMRPAEGSYAVFLDVNLPFQTDLAIVGLAAVEPREYYESLNRFFKLVEAKYGIKVIIAAHPKANYGAETFQGREIYRGQTPELVRDADFVISHHSTSFGYAVLNRKPVVFVYTNEMAALYKRTIVRYIRDFANYLDAACYNIDEITHGEQIVLSRVNEQRYEAYKYDFMTSPESENTTTQEIFWRELVAAG